VARRIARLQHSSRHGSDNLSRDFTSGLDTTHADDVMCAKVSQRKGLFTARNVRRILVRGVNAPLPPEEKKILKILLRNGAF